MVIFTAEFVECLHQLLKSFLCLSIKFSNPLNCSSDLYLTFNLTHGMDEGSILA